VSTSLERLFSPLPVGPVTLRNRIVSPPHGTGFAQGGLPSEQQLG
jgi:2,4-dienoyl-CoA reductase-like NADH-dependent reductase (Old Yellow Enzyme family)